MHIFQLGIRRSNPVAAFRAYTSAAAAKIATKTTPSSSSMLWVDFFKLRKQSLRINVGTSVLTGVIGAFTTLTVLGNIEIDVEKPIMGFDPIMVLGGSVCLGGFVGYIFGPFLGQAVFNVKNGRNLVLFKAKDKIFIRHIQANRVDPSSQSFLNPVPDYYGERIYSLKDYQQWLRDCNAFRRKTKEFL